MTAVKDIIEKGEPIPDDVVGFRSDSGEIATRAAGATYTGDAWLSAACGAQCIGHAAVDFEFPLTVTAVREQPAEPERKCPGCGEQPHVGLSCLDARKPNEPEPDVLDLVRQYAQKRVVAAVLRRDGSDEAAELRAEEHADLWTRLEAEVQRLRSAAVTTGLQVAVDNLTLEREELLRQRDEWMRQFRDLGARHEALKAGADAYRNVRDELFAEVEHGRKEIAYLHEIIEEFKAAQPDPLVLSLPTGTVALVGAKTQRRYACADFPYRWRREDGESLSLGEVFADEGGSVTVVMAPPHKPRTTKDNIDELRNWINLAADQKHWEYDEAIYCLDRIEDAIRELVGPVFDDKDGTSA